MTTVTSVKMNVINGAEDAHDINEFIKSEGSEVVVFLDNVSNDTKAIKNFEQHLVHTYKLRVADISRCGKFYVICNLSIPDFMNVIDAVYKNKNMEVKIPPNPKRDATTEVNIIYRDSIDGAKKSMKLSEFQKVCDDYESEPIQFDDGFYGYLKKRPAPYLGHDLD